MGWVLWRLAVALLGLAVGALVGGAIGSPYGASLPAGVLGGVAGLVVAVATDARHGARLLAWLRGTQQESAPGARGYWGEIGYRIERALRARELAVGEEQRQRQQFVLAMEASPGGVLLLDADERIEWCNSAAADHFGIDPRRDRAQRVTNLVRSPAFKAYLAAGRFDDAVDFAAPDGRTMLSVVARGYGDGLTLVLSQDITERERTEAMRRDFVANVSHEIRTPLTVLAGFVEAMATLPLAGAERERVLALMLQQTSRMQTLVADLLMLARLEGSARPGAEQWVPVDAMLGRAEVRAQLLSAGRHELAIQAAGGAEIAGDEAELDSALDNLLSNAVRYTPFGGRIAVRWQARPDGSAWLEVADNGPGIERQHIPRLTERFYRVDGSRSRESGGTGLGLAIVKHVMQRHGGAVEIESEPGRGARFRLVFPAARLRDAPAAPAAVRAPPAATTS